MLRKQSKNGMIGLKHKYKKVIYARHGRFDIQRNETSANVFSGTWSPYRDMLVGNYDVYQYFPFYIFNDFTNLHIGDWDSMVEIFHNTTKNIFWIRTHAHEFAWLTKMVRSNQYTSINNWLIIWNNHQNGVPNIFNVNKHPFIFVSKGGHGCYPTPGYSVRGIGSIKLPIAFEERDIGKSCYIPKAENSVDTLEADVRNVLDRASIKTVKFKPVEYDIIDFDSEAWSTYRGHWGNRSDLKTWDSPVSAPIKPDFVISKDNFMARFNAEYKKGYKSELIFYNYHGLLEIQS